MTMTPPSPAPAPNDIGNQIRECCIHDLIVIDPPWSYYGSQDKWAAAGKFYKTMNDDEIYGLPIRCVLSRRALVFVWATSPRLDAAMTAIDRWGLKFRGVAFTWVKTRKDGKPVGAQGIRASVTKPTCEFVLVASNIAKGRPLTIADESISSVIMAPRREHSRKPDELTYRLECMYPEARKMEIFARRSRTGWTTLGDQTDMFGDLDDAG